MNDESWPRRSSQPAPAPDPRGDRRNEWFVPRFGPERFRLYVGLLFLPYTGMVLAYTVIGSMLAQPLHWERVAAIVIIYFLALGIGAHALDALGSRTAKPWGATFSRPRLRVLAAVSLTLAYAIGVYYMILYTPLLWGIAILEGFFVFAYNLEWFAGRFHGDAWFAVSWGSLPVLAGYVLQTNAISPGTLLVSVAAGLLSLVEIKASRPYKALKRNAQGSTDPCPTQVTETLEAILKNLSGGVILLGIGMLAWRWIG